MAAHACLKNEFTEDEKCHNLMRWLICGSFQNWGTVCARLAVLALLRIFARVSLKVCCLVILVITGNSLEAHFGPEFVMYTTALTVPASTRHTVSVLSGCRHLDFQTELWIGWASRSLHLAGSSRFLLAPVVVGAPLIVVAPYSRHLFLH